ncbi:MAG: RluA family pseudouridine synthase [Erysipelotrichaceae bacterium]|nr:RluA family pseudouridine synthase [Erysipelotrichaceae bacterium]
MKKTLEIKISEEMNGLAIKAVLSRFLGLSRREISRLKFSGGILYNGESARVTQPVSTDDVILLTFPDQDTAAALLIDSKPEILYEDHDLIIVNKPSGMPCHPSHEHLDDDMGTVLQNYYGGAFKVRPVGRLDKDVSGLMLYAKNQPSAARLSKQRNELILHKEYTAIVQGFFEEKKGRLTYSLSKESGRRERVIKEGGQLCITDYEVIEEYENCSKVRVSIITGRTHQIRAGMAYAGHPLCGDRLYGGDTSLIRRAALHCSHLELKQPFTNEKIVIDLEIPDDMKALLNKKTG